MKVYQCEDSTDGIFTAIYDAWNSRAGHDNVRLEVVCKTDEYRSYELFAEYIPVMTDAEKAEKVARSVRSKISEEAYSMILKAALSDYPGKADQIYRFLVIGFKMGAGVVNHLACDAVRAIFEVNRYVGNEVHFFLGFLRFEEAERGILYAKFEPKSNITELVMPHFVDRFQEENLVILDVARRIAGIYQAGMEWFVTSVSDELIESVTICTEREASFQRMWTTFFKSIAIESRKNPKLQRNLCRLHYRKHMTEFMGSDANVQ